MNTIVTIKNKLPSQRRWPLRALVVAGIFMIVLFVILFIWFFSLDISKLAEPLPEPTVIYDIHGELVSKLAPTKIEAVSLEQIPEHLINAVIATEDRRFYTHSGIDFRSIMRALWRDIRSQSLAEGGSTITQQLAKNMFLPTDKTLSRKLKEAAYAIKIEMSYSKDEILMLYLNNIYFGEGQWGIQRAAKTYFSKNTTDLTLAESALLAGLPKAPTHYNPVRNLEAALNRRNVVLLLMKDQEYISESEYQETESSPIVLTALLEDIASNPYADFMDAVMSEATEVYGFTEGQLLSSGLQIYTTVNPNIQLAAEEVYQDDSLFPESMSDQLIQSGVVIIDQTNGGIRAIVGHRGEGVFRGFNFATKLKRQPGSAIKPLAVYGPALEQGYTPSSVLPDKELNIAGYQPQNYDGQTRGDVTLEQALVHSYNIPAVWLLNEIGIDTGIDFVTRTGVTLTSEDRHLGMALGGLSEGTSPLIMAQAFSAFANLGEMYPAHTIIRILSSSGEILTEAKKAPKRVMTPEVAYTMTTLLTNVVNRGTGTAAMLDRPTAGKTGTTQLPDTPDFSGIKGVKDAWFVGYTPELTAAIWLGYENTDRDHFLTTSSSAAAALFQQILSRALVDQPIIPFPIPDDMMEKPDKKPNKSEKGKEENKGKGKGKDKGKK